MGLEPDRGLTMALTSCAAFAVGALGGAAYYLTLWRAVGLIILGAGALKAAAMQLARFVLIATLLAAVTHWGGVALIMTLLGILAARFITVRWLGARP